MRSQQLFYYKGRGVSLTLTLTILQQQLFVLSLLHHLLLLGTTTTTVSAHVRWVYPVPRPASDVKEFPCGANAAGWEDDGASPVTILKPGMNEVIFDEFVCHTGDMVRIALSHGGNDDRYDDYVLLDRLPHNDLCSTSVQRHMAVNITLPANTNEIDCSSTGLGCSLQIIQVMTSKFKGSTCNNPSQIPEQCGGYGRMYFSCARIQILDENNDNSSSSSSSNNNNNNNNNEIVTAGVFNDFYGATSPVDYEWPLADDWCRNKEEEPWRLCDTTITPQAIFPSFDNNGNNNSNMDGTTTTDSENVTDWNDLDIPTNTTTSIANHTSNDTTTTTATDLQNRETRENVSSQTTTNTIIPSSTIKPFQSDISFFLIAAVLALSF